MTGLKKMSNQKQFDDYYGSVKAKKIGAGTTADFKRAVNWYDYLFNYLKKKFNLIQFKNKKVIDLGGGVGAFCKLLEDDGFKNVTCNDISVEALKKAKKFNPDLTIRTGDIEKIKEQMAYDLVFAFEVLEHLHTPESAIKIIYSFLKKNGLFVGTTPFPFPKNLKDPTHKHVFEPLVWRQLFEKTGFKKVRVYPLSFPPLIYRLNKHLNFHLPFYIKNKYFVSTTLIIADKK